MTTQIIPGAFRETNNPLLLRAGIGMPHIRGFTLPADDFTYGITSSGKNCGTADTFSWHTKTKPLNTKDKLMKRDFITLNKAATQSGLVTAQEHSQYRATHTNVKARDKLKDYKRNNSTKLPSLSNNMVYGVSTKPSTPEFNLLEHNYQDLWLDETRRNELSVRKQKREQKKSANKTYSETCASRLRRYSPKVDAPPLWQMPRFQQKAQPKLCTFRSEEAREKAFLHHVSDSTARTGVSGHGIYEDAKS